jgi:hypothetical protein
LQDCRRNFGKPHDKEEILIAEVDLDLQENVRQTGLSLEIEELMLWRYY